VAPLRPRASRSRSPTGRDRPGAQAEVLGPDRGCVAVGSPPPVRLWPRPVGRCVWVVPLATNGVAAEEVPEAGIGLAVVHDDAGNVGNLPYPLPHGKVVSGTGSAVIHDGAGNLTLR
jgi:hypothetical protein